MVVEEILLKIKDQQKIINNANKAISDLTLQLQNANKEDFDYISVKEGAEMLHVSVHTIYRKIDEGKLTCKYINSKKLVRVSELKKINDEYNY